MQWTFDHGKVCSTEHLQKMGKQMLQPPALLDTLVPPAAQVTTHRSQRQKRGLPV